MQPDTCTGMRGRPFQGFCAPLALTTLALVSACAPSTPDRHAVPTEPPPFRGENALREVSNFVALGPRPSGSPGAAAAAAYIRKRLEATGVQAVMDEFEETGPHGVMRFRNVLGEIKGATQSTVIYLSHYDTKAGVADDFAGANDSGSSTGLLLEMASVLAARPPRNLNVLFAFVDGEEALVDYSGKDGLHGSRRLVSMLIDSRRARNIVAVFVADMVGDRDLSITIPRNSTPELVSLVFRAAREENSRQVFSLSRLQILDDHLPFIRAGIPAVDIIDFHYGSGTGENDYWHTPEDTLDKLSARSLQTVGRVLLRALWILDSSPPQSQGGLRPPRHSLRSRSGWQPKRYA